ncbi:hypothetical protein ARMSODRAFT_973829 [Armillaria solidipes]|uniref:Uncharacterized protein n=1 Tax=Armillaria solidipes TaxID=1076256 RepID=A0A2H3BKH6_9AGAR|nr:hypothetical protein ARMSODRAFT_973829 [Armillaria solidipes]
MSHIHGLLQYSNVPDNKPAQMVTEKKRFYSDQELPDLKDSQPFISASEFNQLIKDGPQDDDNVKILRAYSRFQDAEEELADALGMMDTGPMAYGHGILDPTELYYQLLSCHFQLIGQLQAEQDAAFKKLLMLPSHHVSIGEASGVPMPEGI